MAEDRTLKQLIDAFLAHVEIGVNNETTSQKTLRWYDDLLKSLSPLHDRPAHLLRPSDLAGIKVTNGRGRVIKCLFAWAVDQDHIPKNYFGGRKFKVPRCGRRKRTLERKEMAALLQASSPALRRLFYVMYQMIARPGEIRSLTWGQINWCERYVTLREFKGKERRSDQLEERTLGVNPEVIRALAYLHRRSPDRSATGCVFYAPRGKPWTANGLRLAMTRAADRAGLRADGSEKVCGYHLRHTAATNAIQDGEGIVHVAIQMGHASIVTTQRYCHLNSKDIVQSADRIVERKRTRARTQQTNTAAAPARHLPDAIDQAGVPREVKPA